jgi:hypothetical protein
MFDALTREDRIIYGTLLVVAVLLVLIIWWGIRVRKAQDVASREITLDEVLQLVQGRLFADTFLWCIWQGRLSGKEFSVHIRDQSGAELTVMTLHHIPRGGVLKEFDWAGKHYEYAKQNLLASRILLRDSASGEVLCSCQHRTFTLIFYAGQSDQEIFRMPYTTVFRDYRPVIRNGREIGRLIMPGQLHFHLPVLSLEENTLSREQQLFLLAAILGK